MWSKILKYYFHEFIQFIYSIYFSLYGLKINNILFEIKVLVIIFK